MNYRISKRKHLIWNFEHIKRLLHANALFDYLVKTMDFYLYARDQNMAGRHKARKMRAGREQRVDKIAWVKRHML